jgi:hypothetical protein
VIKEWNWKQLKVYKSGEKKKSWPNLKNKKIKNLD